MANAITTRRIGYGTATLVALGSLAIAFGVHAGMKPLLWIVVGFLLAVTVVDADRSVHETTALSVGMVLGPTLIGFGSAGGPRIVCIGGLGLFVFAGMVSYQICSNIFESDAKPA